MKSKLILVLLFLLLFLKSGSVYAVNQTNQTDGFDTFLKLINDIFFTGVNQENFKITPGPRETPFLTPLPGTQLTNYYHYYQCDPTFNPPTNPTCGNQSVICHAGCGQTTVAMILSSFGKVKNPLDVYRDYVSSGYLSGCDGSFMPNAMTVLSNNGITTGKDFVPYSQASPGEVAADLKDYFTNGWTGFALADFCDRADTKCSHFFWITNIDTNGNIITNDAVRGKGYVQSSSDPFPKYKYVFLVKMIL